MSQLKSILETTIDVCVEEQDAAAVCAELARLSMGFGNLKRAIHQQENAAWHSIEVRIRLDRINGHS